MKLLGRFLLLLLFYGCNKDKLKAPAAFYLKPNTVSVKTTSVEGTTSSKITDLWLYVNGNFKGVYPTGNTLPIVSYGPTEIKIYPGIKNNGISSTRVPYEFLEYIPIDTAVDDNTIVDRNLTFKYKSTCKFHIVEGFEGGTAGINIKKSDNSDTTFAIVQYTANPSGVYEGSGSFYFGLDGNRLVGQFQSTNDQFALPAYGAPVFMELNFKCNQTFEVGVYNGYDYHYAATVNRSDNWNKIYVNLTSAVSTNPYSTYGYYIKAIKDPDVEYPTFFIDNIKIISY